MPTTLLLADDSVTIQRVIELTFATEDVQVVAMGDGRQAVEWLEAHVPDVLLADVTVPGVDGYGLAEFVKQSDRLRHVPVLLLAGAFEPVDDDRVRALFCEGVLVKPFEPQQLVTRVRELIDRRAAAIDAPPAPAPVTGMPAIAATPADAENLQAAAVLTPEPDPEPERRAEPAVAHIAAEPAVQVSLASVFAALLAAERSIAPAAVAVPVDAGPEAADPVLEAAVRRVLVRMSDDLVRRMLSESAERLIKEEIAKIQTQPE